jgi:FMN phosphatase YigB (HAD superfamily)
MMGKYLTGDYDLANSFVIGDRATDVELARNMGCKAILLQENMDILPPFLSTTIQTLLPARWRDVPGSCRYWRQKWYWSTVHHEDAPRLFH